MSHLIFTKDGEYDVNTKEGAYTFLKYRLKQLKVESQLLICLERVYFGDEEVCKD